MENTIRGILLLLGAALVSSHATSSVAQPAGDVKRGAEAYKVCAACHSLEPGRNLTGPSLANVFGRQAGTVPDFQRYSDALRKFGAAWNEQNLDAWLKDPEKLVPGNDMAFPGIKADQARRDLIAYLRSADALAASRPAGPRLPNLKKAEADSIVKALRHCRDTYFVTTDDGKLHKIWEFNLRLKTDTSDSGPTHGKPVLLGVGMRGDRAAVVFASPAEISALVNERCE